ncbi:MAG: SDR family NAD(P)-dependent oxidoreductase, partial [Rhodospirillales bacterium]|nr:SDR family NAD(P)-dependent oxidoreductase [Rhodospirillales bacterium]
MDLGFTGRVAVVTGGSSGIGLATVRALLDEGAKVAFFARGEARLNEALDRLKAVHGDRVHAEPCDVLDKDAVAGFRDSVARTFGKADVLINNAGQAHWATFAETTDDDWRAELELKYFSVINPIRAFLPDLEASGAGAVVMVNSLLARQPEPHLVATASARAGILSLVKSLSTEFAPKGI